MKWKACLDDWLNELVNPCRMSLLQLFEPEGGLVKERSE
jgi:hypothetical protein